MSFRFWIGTWTTVILIIFVAIDASALICYITRFTEENFATLIAFIFIYKAIENMLSIGKKFPLNSHPSETFATIAGVTHHAAIQLWQRELVNAESDNMRGIRIICEEAKRGSLLMNAL